MTKAIQKAEQSELAKLVEQREELQATLTRLKRTLRNLPEFDRARLEQYQKEHRESLRQRLLDAKDNLTEWQTAEEFRQQLLETSKHNQHVHDLLFQSPSNWNSFAYKARNARDSIKSLEAQLAKEPEPIVDPHIEVTNGIASVEYKLAEVRSAIKGLMPR